MQVNLQQSFILSMCIKLIIKNITATWQWHWNLFKIVLLKPLYIHLRHRSSAQINDQSSSVNFHFTTITQNCFISVVLRAYTYRPISYIRYPSYIRWSQREYQTTMLVLLRTWNRIIIPRWSSTSGQHWRWRHGAARRQHLYENHENDAIKWNGFIRASA